MKYLSKYALILATLLPGTVCLMLPHSAQAQVTAAPSLMNFQGRLTKPDGTPVADGTYSVRFSLWNGLSAGTETWNQTVGSVAVKNGTFAVQLSGFPANTFNSDQWLEIKIGTDAPLTPRQPLVSVPYALKANSVPDGSITGASIANGAITSDKLASGALNNLSWLLGGNSGTNPASQFIGTTDNQPLVFKTNNAEKMRLLANGNLGLFQAEQQRPNCRSSWLLVRVHGNRHVRRLPQTLRRSRPCSRRASISRSLVRTTRARRLIAAEMVFEFTFSPGSRSLQRLKNPRSACSTSS